MGRNVKSLHTLACLSLGVLALGLAGCRTTEYTQTGTEYTHPATQRYADRQLALDVADDLRKAPDSTFPNVAVSANHGRVLLRGFVSNEALKAEAGQIAAQVPGVTEVVNSLAVRPNAPVGAATGP